MARPTKNGLDYFPHSCQDDPKLQYIEARFGFAGWAIYFKLLQKIYGGEGYYLLIDDEYKYVLKKEFSLADPAELDELFDVYTKKEFFNKWLFNNYNILTSEGIQARYIEATKRRRRREIFKEYQLIDLSKVENSVTVHINSINAHINGVNDRENEQSIVNESKGLLEKEEQIKIFQINEEEAMQRLRDVIDSATPGTWHAKRQELAMSEEKFIEHLNAWTKTKAFEIWVDDRHIINSFKFFISGVKEKNSAAAQSEKLMPNYYNQGFMKTLSGQAVIDYERHLKNLGWQKISAPGGTTWTKPQRKQK